MVRGKRAKSDRRWRHLAFVPKTEPRTRTPQVTGGAVRELSRKPRPR